MNVLLVMSCHIMLRYSAPVMPKYDSPGAGGSLISHNIVSHNLYQLDRSNLKDIALTFIPIQASKQLIYNKVPAKERASVGVV